MKSKKFKYLKLVVVLLAFIGGISALMRYFYQVNPTFPNVAAGVYTGYISGLNIERSYYVPVLIERSSADRPSITVVPFLEGFEPQQAKLEPKGQLIEGMTLSEGISYEPIKLHHSGLIFSLYGQDKGDRIRGKVLVSGAKGNKGAWKVYPQAEEVISQKDIELSVYDFDLPAWLKAKSEYRFLEETIDSLNSVTTEQEKSIQKLEAHIGDQQVLKRKAAEQRERITKEATSARREQADLEKEVNSSAEELTLQSRITKKGQVVGLARRTAGREAKWYLANWQTKEDSGAMDEAVRANLNIDFQKLSEASRQAQEIHALRQEIIREKEKIQELRERLAAKEEGEKTEVKKPAKEAPKKEEQGFWDKVFGL